MPHTNDADDEGIGQQHKNSNHNKIPQHEQKQHQKTDTNQPNKQKHNHEEHKEMSLQNCDELGRHYFRQCFEINSKTGQCHSKELPMRIKDCMHLKKFINTNLHTLVEAPNKAVDVQHAHYPAAPLTVHANGEHVGAFVTAKNVMCCTVDMENALHHAIQMINNRLMVAHELALYRFAHEIPVDDPEREATVLKHVGNQANAAGIDAEFAVNFLLAQMEANKMIQRGYINRWNSDHSFESKYVPDLEKEILPKFSYATNALILALIPLVNAGHQMYNDQNCVEHVEYVLESMEHLRASELEPNGKAAMEKAVKAICDKVLIHEAHQTNSEDRLKSSKKRQLSEIKRDVEEENHGDERNIQPAKRAHKTNKDEQSKSPSENKKKHRNNAHSQTTKETHVKISPKKVENEYLKKMESKKLKAKNNEVNDNKKDVDQKRNLKKAKEQQKKRGEEAENDCSKSINLEKDGDEIASRKRPAVSNKSDKIKPAEKTRGDNFMHTANNDKKAKKQGQPKDSVEMKKKSTKKTPRRIEVSDRSVLIQMDDLFSDENEHLTSVEKGGISRAESDEDATNDRNKPDQKRIADVVDKSSDARLDSIMENSRKITSNEKFHENSRSSTEKVRNSSIKYRNSSVPLNSRNTSAAEIGNTSMASRNEWTLLNTKKITDIQRENEQKDSLELYRDRLTKNKKNNLSKSIGSEENLKKIEFSRNNDKSLDESNELEAHKDKTAADGNWSIEETENPEKPRRVQQHQNADNRQNSNLSLMAPSEQTAGISSTEHEEHEPIQNQQKSKFSLRHQSDGNGEQNVTNDNHIENIMNDAGNDVELKSDEFHHIELEPDAESIVIHTPGAEKPVKIKLSRKTANGNENTKNEDNKNGRSAGQEILQEDDELMNKEIHHNNEEDAELGNSANKGKPTKNKFKMKKAASSISDKNNDDAHNNIDEVDDKKEMQSDETQKIVPKNKFKIKKAISNTSAAELETYDHKNEENFDAKVEEQNDEIKKNSQKNRFKLKRVDSEGQHLLDGQSEEQTKKLTTDRSKEYVEAPEKMSAEFAAKSAEANNQIIADYSENFDDYGGQN